MDDLICKTFLQTTETPQMAVISLFRRRHLFICRSIDSVTPYSRTITLSEWNDTSLKFNCNLLCKEHDTHLFIVNLMLSWINKGT